MNKYVLDKKYSLLHPISAREELRQLRFDILRLEGFGGIRLVPVFYEMPNKYELVSDLRGLEGHLQIQYYLKDVVGWRARIPRSINLHISTLHTTQSLDAFVKRYNLRTN